MPTMPATPAGRPPCGRRCGSAVCASRADECRFDARKVARMQEALRRGSFEVNAEFIAERLLARGHGALAAALN